MYLSCGKTVNEIFQNDKSSRKANNRRYMLHMHWFNDIWILKWTKIDGSIFKATVIGNPDKIFLVLNKLDSIESNYTYIGGFYESHNYIYYEECNVIGHIYNDFVYDLIRHPSYAALSAVIYNPQKSEQIGFDKIYNNCIGKDKHKIHGNIYGKWSKIIERREKYFKFIKYCNFISHNIDKSKYSNTYYRSIRSEKIKIIADIALTESINAITFTKDIDAIMGINLRFILDKVPGSYFHNIPSDIINYIANYL